MKLHILFGQRKCSYPGEYAPEALAVHDDNARSDNPDYLDEELEKCKESDEFTSLEIVTVEVDGAAIERILAPKHPTLVGKVVDE